MTSPIALAFRRARDAGRSALIPYVTAGDPSLADTRTIILALQRGGADIIELGVPFTDPIADGVVNQRSAERALLNGTSLARILELVGELRQAGAPPLVLFTYYNPIHALGLQEFRRRAQAAGLAGILVTDLPPEEAGPLRVALDGSGIERIGFLAPATPLERVRRIAADSQGFLYAIARTGVTGVRDDLPEGLEPFVSAARKAAGDLPVAVGFGISRGEQVRAIGRFADGVVVGSALVRVIEAAAGSTELEAQVERFCRDLL